MGRLQSLQVLRFLAAALVVALHSYVYATGHLRPREATILSFGVDIFFVISGFIITRTAFVDGRPGAGAFIRKRLVRIVPMYFLTSLLLVPILLTAPLAMYVATFAFWPATAHGSVMPLNFVGWTLCFEMLFYACAAFLLLPGSRILKGAFLAIAYAACLWARYALRTSWFDFLGNAIMLEFILGVLVALMWRGPSVRLGLLMVGLGTLLVVLAQFANLGMLADGEDTLHAITSPYRVLFLGLPAGLIVAGAIRLEPLFGRLGWAAFAGDASYSLYLIHPMVGEALQPLHIGFVAIFGACLASGLLAYHLVERPMLYLIRSRAEKSRLHEGRQAAVGS